MRFAVIFTLAGLGLLALAANTTAWWSRVLGVDFGLVCLLLGAAYALNRPGFFLKNADGRIPPVGWLIYWPYFALNLVALRFFRARAGAKAFQPIAGKVWLGCRADASDAATLNAVPITAVLDLVAEFSEAPFLRNCPTYRSLPLLDTRAPTLAQLRAGVEFIEQEQRQHPVYVHCAIGHGRSACFVLAWLLHTGRAITVESGLEQLRRLRPGVGFYPEQHAVLVAFAADLKLSSPGNPAMLPS